MRNNRFKLFMWFGLAAVLIFTPLARGAVRIWSIAPVLIVIYSLLFIWLRKLNSGEEKRPDVDKPAITDGFILIFAILAIASFVFSIYKHDSFYALLRLFAYIGIFYLVKKLF